METNPLKRLFRRFFGKPSVSPLDGRIGSVDDIEEGKPFCADIGGRELAVFKVNGKYHAIDNICPHAGGPLCKGKVAGGEVTCPWHGSKFRIEDGAVTDGPAKSAVASYPVEVRGRDLYVKAPAKTAEPKRVAFSFQPTLDTERPFSHEPFVNELMEGVKFPFKLYGTLRAVAISQGPDEIDLHLGEIHITEMDLQKLSALMSAMNGKWHTSITYCLFHSSRYPGAMLLNIRGPKAPMNVSSDIPF